MSCVISSGNDSSSNADALLRTAIFFVSCAISFDGDLISSMERETLTLPATPAA
jgi:hypothetical protein